MVHCLEKSISSPGRYGLKLSSLCEMYPCIRDKKIIETAQFSYEYDHVCLRFREWACLLSK